MYTCLQQEIEITLIFSMMIDIFVKFYREHLFISIALLLVLIYLLIRKPKTFFLILFIALLFTGVLYLWMYLCTEQNNIIWK